VRALLMGRGRVRMAVITSRMQCDRLSPLSPMLSPLFEDYDIHHLRMS
jgi:hypothetical protein